MLYYQDYHRNKGTSEHLFIRRAGKQKLPKVLVDQDNRKKRDVAILKKVMIQRQFLSPGEDDSGNMDLDSNYSVKTTQSNTSHVKKRKGTLARKLRKRDFVEESETTSDSDIQMDSDMESNAESVASPSLVDPN